MEKGRRSPLYVVLSVALTAGVFLYLSRYTSWEDVFAILRGIDLEGVALFVLLSLSMSFFRTWRYGLVLKTSGYTPPAGPLFLVVLVRNFLSDLLPARLGTLSYVYLATSRLGIALSGAVSSFALSFLFDIAALAPLIAIAVLVVGLSTQAAAVPILLACASLLAVLTGALCLYLPALFSLAGKLYGVAPLPRERWRTRGVKFFGEAEKELRHAREEGIYLRLLALSVMVRLCKYGSLYALLYALLRPLDYGIGDMSPAKVFLGLLSSELAASLPVSGIAGFGVYEGTWSFVFTLLGMPSELAVTTGISHHLFTQVYGYGLGALALLLLLALPLKNKDGVSP